MHPFLDVGKLTDEEIIDKLNKAYTYLDQQQMLGHNPTVDSIMEVIESLEIEREERLNKSFETEFANKYPDHDKPIDIGKIEE